MHPFTRTKKLKSNRRYEEYGLQKGVAEFFEYQAVPGLAWLAIEVGGYRHPAEAARLKTCGVKKGTPDGLVVWRGQPVFIELKSERGRLSPAQKSFHGYLRQAGAQVEVVRSLEQLEALLKRLGVNSKVSINRRKNNG